jgi:pyrophosphatase PpaX
MTLRGVIFDLDGTLVNTLPVCYAAFRDAFQAYLGREFTNEEIAATFGPSEEGSIQRLVPDQWEACLKVFLEAYEAHHTLCTEPFPGVLDMLHLLRERRIPYAVVTGKGPHSAEISLRRTGLTPLVEILEAGSPQGGIKPECIGKIIAQWAIPRETVIYVGDAPSDVPAARKAGVAAIAAAWAETAPVEQLEQMQPDALFRSVPEFTRWLLPRLSA